MTQKRTAQLQKIEQKPRKSTSRFHEFQPYEGGRIRNLKYDVNALADFEQETGMGFAELLSKRAVFAAARALIWAGLKHEDRALSIERVGELISDYLRDEQVEQGTHTVDSILQVALAAAVEQGALGRQKKEEPKIATEGDEEEDEDKKDIDLPNDEPGSEIVN